VHLHGPRMWGAHAAKGWWALAAAALVQAWLGAHIVHLAATHEEATNIVRYICETGRDGGCGLTF